MLHLGTIAKMIQHEVASWPDVSVASHRFGGIEFRAGRRELGHLHGDKLADLLFPVRVRAALVAAGRAVPHHVLPDSGWVSFYIKGLGDVPAAIALFRPKHERVTATRAGPSDPRSSI